jgi:hypothetical protein
MTYWEITYVVSLYKIGSQDYMYSSGPVYSMIFKIEMVWTTCDEYFSFNLNTNVLINCVE